MAQPVEATNSRPALAIGGGMAGNGEAPVAPAVLYRADVMHARLKPFGHRFNYKVFNLLIDIDRLAEAGRMSPLFSVGGFNLVAFHPRDHLDASSRDLRSMVDRMLAQAGLAKPAARVLLLCYPRVAGFVFNPISVYFAYDAEGALIAAIYEVRNTFGHRHTYVCKVAPGQLSDAGLRQNCAKRLHVSPFVGMEAAYDFRLLPPGETVRVRILETQDRSPLLSATLIGRARRLSTGNVLVECLRAPLMTLKVVAGIHYEALKLWLKGARYHSIPAPPPAFSLQEGELKSREPVQ
jgi:uncharacterized protein